jgi:hypothetical protein
MYAWTAFPFLSLFLTIATRIYLRVKLRISAIGYVANGSHLDWSWVGYGLILYGLIHHLSHPPEIL